ncbi:hypothetical protein EIP86_001602 [Pleurotus ostreatoroseus]|nr:hypothetical protein EIP86_001602 [Pleurotus ostreatoroseus]
MLDCDLGIDSIWLIASRCTSLERLAVYVPKKNVVPFCSSLQASKSLKVLSDVGESHTTHGTHPFLKRSNVMLIMESVPTLKRIAADGRVWLAGKRSGLPGEDFELKVEKRRTLTPSYWFLPPLHTSYP